MSPGPLYRDDIVCHRTGEKIPLTNTTISRWSDSTFYVYCQKCRVFHQFICGMEVAATSWDGREE